MFFDREQETAAFFKLIAKGKNILMLAPRRVGKTELMYRIGSLAEAQNFRSVIFDMEGYREEKDFFQQLCSSIQEEIGVGGSILTAATQRLKQFISGAGQSDDWRQILLKSDWREFADHLLAELDGDKNGGRQWLIMVDELPIFVAELLKSASGQERASAFLYWLRNARQKYRNIRWLYTGSIGLDAVSRREGMEGALLGLEIFTLHPFQRDIAAAFIDRLAADAGCSVDGDAMERLLDGLGWLSPYYLEKLAEAAFERKNRENRVDIDAATAALESMLALQHRLYWASWREHLTKNFTDPERTRLFRVLEIIAVNGPQPVSRNTLLTTLNSGGEPVTSSDLAQWLDTLEADGYLLAADNDRNAFIFQMNLLREWWLRYVVTGS